MKRNRERGGRNYMRKRERSNSEIAGDKRVETGVRKQVKSWR